MKSVRVYHGTNTRFSKFEQSRARIVNDYYGGGVAYFTDTIGIAKGYANAMSRRYGGDRFVYEVSLRINKLFDVNDKFTGDVLRRLVGNNVESFARGAGLLKLGADRVLVLGDLREGKTELTGDQVFRGLSNGMTNTAFARKKLISAGYDCLRHDGGGLMGGDKHNVYLSYEANNIQIMNRYIISPTPVPATALRESYTYIN